jgi:hypothetical protein
MSDDGLVGFVERRAIPVGLDGSHGRSITCGTRVGKRYSGDQVALAAFRVGSVHWAIVSIVSIVWFVSGVSGVFQVCLAAAVHRVAVPICDRVGWDDRVCDGWETGGGMR